MARKKTWTTPVFAGIGTMILILDSQTAVQATAEAVQLCIRVVIPSLFPLFVLSMLLTGSLGENGLTILRPAGRLLGLSPHSDPLLLTGFLGGYPTGAQCVAHSYSAGSISKQDAEKMLSFCSNAGPSFIFGIAGSLFTNRAIPWLLWLIQILSALYTGIFFGSFESAGSHSKQRSSITPTEALQKSIRAMASVCGWILLFRCLIAYCEKWFLSLLPEVMQALFTGMLELTNGCWFLHNIADEQLRFVLCSVFLSFGSICVVMQTQAVTDGLCIIPYILGKLLQAATAAALSAGISFFLYRECSFYHAFLFFAVTAALVITIYLKRFTKIKKEVAFPNARVYNECKDA